MPSKGKMISFRLSDEEYVRFHEVCVTLGTKNVSELARVAVHRLIDAPDSRELGVQEQFCKLRSRLEDLTLDVCRLSKAVTEK
jgi:hypothetical protein